jgi:hypothetical protein
MKVKTEKELGEALKNKEETIEITGDLAKKTIKIRATGKVAWVVAFGAIGIAVYAVASTIPTGGTSAPIAGQVAGITGGAAVTILGGAATYSAIAVAIAAGGIGALTSLRKYKEISRSPTSLVLKRR